MSPTLVITIFAASWIWHFHSNSQMRQFAKIFWNENTWRVISIENKGSLSCPASPETEQYCFENHVYGFENHSNQGFMILRIQLKLNTALLSYCPFVRASVTGVTSHISHIYKGINAMLTIRGPIKPCIFWIKIILAFFLAKTRPDKTIFSALTNLTIDFDFELSKI